MSLSSKDRTFNTKKVSYLDFKQLEMDRVLTALFAEARLFPGTPAAA